MNIQTQKPVSKFRDIAPPGVKVETPQVKEEVTDAVELKFRESGPDVNESMPMWKKIGAASMAVFSGMMVLAPKAHAAPIDALVTQEISDSDGLEVVVLPRGTARVDLLPKQVKSGEGTEFRNVGHTDTGVHLG